MYEMLDMGGSSNVIYSVNQFIGNACKCLLLPSTKNASQSFFWSFNESGFIDHPGFKKEKKTHSWLSVSWKTFPYYCDTLLSLLILVSNF